MNIQENILKLSIIPSVSLIFSITGCFLTDDKLFKASLKYCRVFSSGVFFSILFFDLIPDLVNDISYKETKKNPNTLILPFMTILVSYIIMLIIGKSIEKKGGCPNHNHDEKNQTLNNSENQEKENKKENKINKKNNKENKKNNKENIIEKNNKSELKITLEEKEIEEKEKEPLKKINKTMKVFYTFLIHDFFTGIFIALSLNSKSFESTLAALILHKLIEGLSLGMKFGSEDKNKSLSIFKLTILSSMIFFGTLLGLIGTEFFKKLTVFSESVIIGSFLYISIDENSVKLFTRVKDDKTKAMLLSFYFMGIAAAFFIFNHEAFF